ncbi:hypothetical protein HYPSUDRAFT_897135 [Hypholoma sublateritium FD-334 SS-4]|uniref:WSC domain-containing protein n=1 Tax=Hypholoma sublateritium (strain FD-334 SS-4) TaxID=945553 RepID=A0A0D2M7J6_HYPSF|nr:hypothetical protein HYPSUDRAFT_897135 [Hypholoma sublateritium FD-334 SS-4]
MSFATVIATVVILPIVLALPSRNLDAQILRRQTSTVVPDPNDIPANWTFVGCFSDAAPASRTLLQAQSPDNPAMTPLLCTEFCSGTDFATPFNFAGTEFTSQCFCDFDIQGTATLLPNSSCNFPCGGDANLTCGGASVISVYQNLNANVGPIPANKAVVGNWTFDGCVTDVVGNNTRSLTIPIPIPAGVTVETCTETCEANGFSITGLEFGGECWCGDSFLVPNITAPVTDCSRACDADHTELCGAANRLTIYTLKPPVITTAVPTTVKPTTIVPTTVVPPTTVKPTTAVPTTVVPPTTVKPTTVAPTTVAPTSTAKPVTTAVPPTTAVPTTVKPTTVAPTATKAA